MTDLVSQGHGVKEDTHTDSVTDGSFHILPEIRIRIIQISDPDHGKGYSVCLHGIPVNGSRLILIFGNGYALGHSSLKLRSVTAVKALFRHGRYRRSLQNKKPAECERRQTFSCTVLMK